MNNDNNKSEEVLSQADWVKHLNKVFADKGIPAQPTFTGARGIQIDFCHGIRVYIPKSAGDTKFLLTLVDLDNDIKLYSGVLDPGDFFISEKHYFIRFGIQISEYPSGEKIMQHRFDAKDQNVVVRIPVTTLGDTLAWFPSVVEFQKRHQCKMFVCAADYIRPLLEEKYPEITFIKQSEIVEKSPYACYTLAIFHEDHEGQNSPVDYRQIPLHHYPAYLLGVPVCDKAPKIAFDRKKREIEEPYVCIASQASGGCKLWHHPLGWDGVVKFLKDSGYRVIDIDLQAVHGHNIHWNRIPREAEDFTGNHPLAQRANLIHHADFFIGLGSGLSWLAWCVGKPAVLISGFSESWGEFPTPYRVINRNVCHGCFNDTRHRFENNEWLWCPLHKNTDRHWECSRAITAKMVIDKIKTIPEFIKHQKQEEKS